MIESRLASRGNCIGDMKTLDIAEIIGIATP
jgi:hypothetical protein